MDWITLLAYISGSVDEELLLRIEYLAAENRILRDQIKGRVQLNDAERQTLAEIGKKLGKQALEEVANIVIPDTILSWHRKLAADKLTARFSADIPDDPIYATSCRTSGLRISVLGSIRTNSRRQAVRPPVRSQMT